MTYQGCGDEREMQGIARNLREYITSGEYTQGEVINEIMTCEYNLDSFDVAYVTYLITHNPGA